MTQTDFFKNQLIKTIDLFFNGQTLTKNSRFVIIPSDLEKEKPSTNWDDIINWWVLPTKAEIQLPFDELIDTLSVRQGLLPLWVKISQQSDDIFILNISRRFRKSKDIKEYHKNSETMPFSLDSNSDFIFNSQVERVGLTRKLLWNFCLNEQQKREFIDSPLTVLEVRQFFERHFTNYLYFPPDYNHREPDTIGFSKLVIKKLQTGDFFIVEDIGTDKEHFLLQSRNANNIFDYYFNNELIYKIDKLLVEK